MEKLFLAVQELTNSLVHGFQEDMYHIVIMPCITSNMFCRLTVAAGVMDAHYRSLNVEM